MTSISIYNDGEATSYELVEQLTRGGEGQTWRARQTGPGGRPLPVAVKVLTPDDHLGATADPLAVLGTWRDQMHVMRNFGHEGFAPVQVAFAISPSPRDPAATPAWMVGLPAFVMAWVDGVALHEWSRPITDPLERLQALTLCASGLDAFHRETQHVHADLKPANIVVTGGRGRIIDFGLVRSAERARSRSAVAGTVGYLAPELFEGAPYSAQTDLYAFAAIVFHQLVLRHPSPTRQPGQIARQLRFKGLPGAADVVERALHHDPTRRDPDLTATRLLEQALRFSVAPSVSFALHEREDPARTDATAVMAKPARTAVQPQRPAAPVAAGTSHALIARLLTMVVVPTAGTVALILLIRAFAT